MDIETEIRTVTSRGYSELRITAKEGLQSSGVSWVCPDQVAQEVSQRLRSGPAADLEWTDFDYDDKRATCPPAGLLVWIVEEFYEDGVTVGYYDGVTFRNFAGSDDIFVLKWATMVMPGDPRAS